MARITKFTNKSIYLYLFFSQSVVDLNGLLGHHSAAPGARKIVSVSHYFVGFVECVQPHVCAGCMVGAPGITGIAKLFCDALGSRRNRYEQKRFIGD